jgi:hypothetical protein
MDAILKVKDKPSNAAGERRPIPRRNSPARWRADKSCLGVALLDYEGS